MARDRIKFYLGVVLLGFVLFSSGVAFGNFYLHNAYLSGLSIIVMLSSISLILNEFHKVEVDLKILDSVRRVLDPIATTRDDLSPGVVLNGNGLPAVPVVDKVKRSSSKSVPVEEEPGASPSPDYMKSTEEAGPEVGGPLGGLIGRGRVRKVSVVPAGQESLSDLEDILEPEQAPTPTRTHTQAPASIRTPAPASTPNRLPTPASTRLPTPQLPTQAQVIGRVRVVPQPQPEPEPEPEPAEEPEVAEEPEAIEEPENTEVMEPEEPQELECLCGWYGPEGCTYENPKGCPPLHRVQMRCPVPVPVVKVEQAQPKKKKPQTASKPPSALPTNKGTQGTGTFFEPRKK